jgi:osmotically inducible protein OsmC
MTTSSATATWTGGLKDGRGVFEARSGSFKGEYTFATRFEGRSGTTPEELIAAAHAACISMAVSGGLERAGTPPRRITTQASCTIEPVDGKQRITTILLTMRGEVPGIDQAAFEAAAMSAKENCPVSKALMNNVRIELSATLES